MVSEFFEVGECVKRNMLECLKFVYIVLNIFIKYVKNCRGKFKIIVSFVI